MAANEVRKTILKKIAVSAEATTDPDDLLKLAQACAALATASGFEKEGSAP